MKIICSYCRGDLGEKEPLEDLSVTHGMCEECLVWMTRVYGGMRQGEFLDEFDLPALAVQADGRVIAANQAMADAQGRPERELFGLLGGEITGCVYARLPKGCGRTSHCRDCTVRNTVNAARQTGEDQVGVPAWIDTEAGRMELRISTYLRQDPEHVLLVIEEMKPPQG